MKHSLLAEMLGIYIVERRRAQNITQSALAHHLGFSAQFLGRIEKGFVMMPEAMLAKTVSILGLDIARCRKIYRLSAEKAVEDLFHRAENVKLKKLAR